MEETGSQTGCPKVKVYDFKRPDKFSKDQIRTVAIMHETFARLSTTTISSQLRSMAHLNVASVDQLTYEEFIRSIPSPTALGILHMDPLMGSAVLQIDPSVSFCIVDRLFGGKGEWGNLTRELTEVEIAVMSGIFVGCLGNLRQAWTTVLDLRPRLGQIETKPQFAQIVPPSEMIVLVTIHVKLSGAEGMMNLVLPFLTIEPIISKLSAQYWYSSVRKKPHTPFVAPSGLDVAAEVLLEGERLTLRDIGRLKRGSRVRVPGADRGEAFLRAGGRTLFRMERRNGGRRKPLNYAVAEGVREDGGQYFAPAEAKAGTDETESETQRAIKDLGRELGASLAGMKTTISALQQKQEEMADQLAMGPQTSAEVEGNAGRVRPFDFVRKADSAHFLAIIQQEHPQLIALVLSYLEPHYASIILGGLPAEIRPDVARRIACLDRTSPEVLREVERVLDKKLSVLSSEDYTSAGGVESVVEILNMADRSTEKHIVDILEKKDPGLAEEIKKRMFVFEDIVLLDGKDVEKIVKKTDPDLLLRALKAVEEKVKAFVWDCIAKPEAEKLSKRFDELGRVRLNEVEAAQQKVVGLIREMEENGEIVVARPSEMIG
jgi:flagellar motor switch protein FliM